MQNTNTDTICHHHMKASHGPCGHFGCDIWLYTHRSERIEKTKISDVLLKNKLCLNRVLTEALDNP